jgi:hypothetical protein
MTDGVRNTVAPEGRRLVFRSLLVGAVAAVVLLVSLRNCRSDGGERSSGVAMVFMGVTNVSGGNYARFTITNHPGYMAFHFARVEVPTATGWTVEASNVAVGSMPFGISIPLRTTNERVRFVFEVGAGKSPPFEWLRWFYRRPHRQEFLTNEVTLPPISR